MKARFLSLLLAVLYALPAQAADSPAGAIAPAKSISVVVGARKPRALPWTSDLTLLDVIKRAVEGLTYMTPLRKVRLTRGTDRTLIELRPIERGEIPDLKLKPGDIIEIPE